MARGLSVRRYAELLLFATAVVLLAVQHLQHQHHMAVLRSAGPVGYVLRHGRRWVMGPALASGRGRSTLARLEQQQQPPPPQQQQQQQQRLRSGGGEG